MISTGISVATEQALRNLSVFLLDASSGHLDPRSAVIFSSTVAEAYVDQALTELATSSVAVGSAFGSAMLDRHSDGMHGSWPSRVEWLRAGFAITLGDLSEYNNLTVLIELRNAIVHGPDQLTERQVRSVSDVMTLRHRLESLVNVSTQGRSLHYSPLTPAAAILLARKFVITLDPLVQAALKKAH